MAGAGAKYGTKVEPEPKVNNFGSATLLIKAIWPRIFVLSQT